MNDCIIFEGGGHFGGKYPAGQAHRKALEKKLGRPIRPGYECCHTCDTPMCINPDHLWEGTHSENMLDAVKKGRKHGYPGERNPCSRLTSEQTRAIVDAFLSAEFQARPKKQKHEYGLRALAKLFDVTPMAIRYILKREGVI